MDLNADYQPTPSPFTKEEWKTLCLCVGAARQLGDTFHNQTRDYLHEISVEGRSALTRIAGEEYLDNLMRKILDQYADPTDP